MPRIESTVVVNAPLDRVWEVAMRVEEFPEFMPDLKSLKVLERSDDGLRTVTEWVGIVKEFHMTVKWTEEDIWNPDDRSCFFRMIKGDMQKYEGRWKFTEHNGSVQFDSVIDFEYEVPLIGPLIKNIIAAKVRENADNVINNIKARAESAI